MDRLLRIVRDFTGGNSVRMGCLRQIFDVIVHETFYTHLSLLARDSTHSEIEDEPGIMRGKSAEFGRRHVM
jgi:hypothetical protein